MRLRKIITAVSVIAVCASLLTGCQFGKKEQETTTVQETTTMCRDLSVWKDKYEEYLLSVLNGGTQLSGYELDLKECRFGLADINGGEVPELLISEGEYQGSKVDIYSFDGYEVRFLGSAGAYGRIRYTPGASLVYSHDETEDQVTDAVYVINEYTLERKWEGVIFADTAEEGTVKYFSDDSEVTEEEYNSLYAENIPSEAASFGRGAPILTAENVMSVIESGELAADTGEEETPEETAQAFDDNCREAYRNLLTEISESGGYTSAPGFALVYIDDDDVPEIAVFTGDTGTGGTVLYSYNGSQAVKLSDGAGFTDGGLHYAEKKGTVVSGFENNGVTSVSVDSLSGGALIHVWSGEKGEIPSESNDGTFTGVYRSEGTDVTAEEYEKLYSDNVPGDGDMTVITYAQAMPATKENIDSALPG